MPIVGSFGTDFVFEVSRELSRSFANLTREGGARLAATEIIGREPVVEYLGPESEAISFTMQLSSQLGIEPQAEYDRLREICDAGEARALVVGGKLVGKPGEKWLIEKLSSAYTAFDSDGEPTMIELSISLRKYAPWEKT